MSKLHSSILGKDCQNVLSTLLNKLPSAALFRIGKTNVAFCHGSLDPSHFGVEHAHSHPIGNWTVVEQWRAFCLSEKEAAQLVKVTNDPYEYDRGLLKWGDIAVAEKGGKRPVVDTDCIRHCMGRILATRFYSGHQDLASFTCFAGHIDTTKVPLRTGVYDGKSFADETAFEEHGVGCPVAQWDVSNCSIATLSTAVYAKYNPIFLRSTCWLHISCQLRSGDAGGDMGGKHHSDAYKATLMQARCAAENRASARTGGAAGSPILVDRHWTIGEIARHVLFSPDAVKIRWPVDVTCENMRGDMLFEIEYIDEIIERSHTHFDTERYSGQDGTVQEHDVYYKFCSTQDDVIVMGDIHACIQSMCRFIVHYVSNGVLSEDGVLKQGVQMVFLGDVVDRGPYSLECILILLVLILKNPTRITLIGGNHESCAVHGRSATRKDDHMYLLPSVLCKLGGGRLKK